MPSERPAVPGRLLAAVVKPALLSGCVGALVGALEGALLGLLILPSAASESAVLLLAADRALFLGLLGVALGAVLGLLTLAVRRGKSAPAAQAGPSAAAEPAGAPGR